jgi:hypothetical protein
LSTYCRTYVGLKHDIAPNDAVSQTLFALRSATEECRSARVQFEHGFPWLRIEHLGFYSLRQAERMATILSLVREPSEEAVMLAAQTTAGCAAFGHFVGGRLCRFLSAGDSQWFEIHGDPEPWESDLFSKDFSWEYRVGENSPFHEGTLSRIAAYYRLPGSRLSSHWSIDRGLYDEPRRD